MNGSDKSISAIKLISRQFRILLSILTLYIRRPLEGGHISVTTPFSLELKNDFNQVIPQYPLLNYLKVCHLSKHSPWQFYIGDDPFHGHDD